MTSGLDKLIDEVIRLRREVEELTGEVTALRIMLTAWPVQPPDPPQALH